MRDSTDPTRVMNQPALRSSSGTVWLIVGALFAVASLVPLYLLIFVSRGPSAPLAITIAIAVIGLYLAIVVTRFVTRPTPFRLRTMAVFFLAMAATSLFGMLACLWIERAAAAA